MRRRIHNHVEAVFLFAQYPNGHIYYDRPQNIFSDERIKVHVACAGELASDLFDRGWKVYLVDAPIYKPDKCIICPKRNLRAKVVRKHG